MCDTGALRFPLWPRSSAARPVIVQSAISRACLGADGVREHARSGPSARRVLRMSPDRWMSPRATRHCATRSRPDGMRICTSPRDGAPGASHSLTPTAVTAFLLDLRPRPSTAVASLNSQGRGQSRQHWTPESSVPAEPAWWVTARLVGVELRRDRRRIGGLHAMRYPLHSFLNRGQREILGAPAGIQDQAEITLTRCF